MEKIRQILSDLHAARRKGYGRKLPNDIDFKFIELAEYYANSDTAAREEIRNSVSDESRLLIIGFSDRLSVIADRTNDRRLLLFALIAHSIEDFRYDDRENIFRLALVNHVAEKLDAQPSKLLEKVAQLSSPIAAVALRAFNSRPPELKSIRAMGIIEEQTDEGVSYRYR